MRPLNKVDIKWSPNFAYAIGLITTDGNLSKDGRHLSLTSKDYQLITTFKECLNLTNSIGRKGRGYSREKKYFVLQFGSVNLYKFLLGIGLMPAKSKKLGPVQIPNEFFADFLRGCIDGDGCIDVRSHPESKHPQLRIRIVSASQPFLDWLLITINQEVGLEGGWIALVGGYSVLTYAKNNSTKILKYIYYPKVRSFLDRKYRIAQPFLADVAELV